MSCHVVHPVTMFIVLINSFYIYLIINLFQITINNNYNISYLYIVNCAIPTGLSYCIFSIDSLG